MIFFSWVEVVKRTCSNFRIRIRARARGDLGVVSVIVLILSIFNWGRSYHV